jgi:hypothetical protein
MRDNDRDDSALAGIDLGAWAPPPPPEADALADAVVARMREPAASAAREPAEHGAAAGGSRRRWPIAAAAAAVVVAVAAAGVLVLSRQVAPPPPAGSGEVLAARASHLEIGASSAELDPGAEARWRREGRRIAAAQPRGAALWRVAAEDTLVIDAGAAVASVEASGASLRVEVQMNLSDARVIGASAATAAAVALVTVIVYQGHVNVTSAGQTVRVEPGSTVEVRPREAAREAPTVGAAAPSLEQMKQELRALEQRIAEVEKERAAEEEKAAVSAPQTPPGPRPAPPAPGCDADGLAEKGRDQYAAGQLAAALQSFEQAYACKADPTIAQKAFVVACNIPSVSKARLYWKWLSPVSRQRAVAICVRNGITEDMLDESTPAQADARSAKLHISSRPPAKVAVDGKEVGMSPIEIEVAPGRHRVRFELGSDRFTFAVSAKAGETVTLDKTLQ